MDDFAAQIDSLIASILSIRGDKIVTLAINGEEPFVIDISKDGQFGYDESHSLLFRNKLATAFQQNGGLVVRQILPLKVEREMPNGQKVWNPRKNIYGVYITDEQWIPLSRTEMKIAHCRDAKTGKLLKPEPDIAFRDFPVVDFGD